MKLQCLLISLIATTFTTQAVKAEDVPEGLIDRVVAAYGGDAVRELESFVLFDRFLAPATGQSRTPALDNIDDITQRFVRDISNGRAMIDSVFSSRSGKFQSATINDGDNAWNINYRNMTYTESNNGDPYVFGGGAMRTNDGVLAYELYQVRDDVEYLGTETYMSREHHKVRMPFPSSPDLTLYIDTETALISRMVRDNPVLGQLDYVFEDPTSHNGVVYAGTVNFFIDGRPNLLGVKRSAEFNVSLNANMFELPDGVRPDDHERIDTSEMGVTRISDDVHHIGQGPAFTLFVDAPVGLTAVGGGGGLNARLAHYREQTGNHRPLRYQIVTHHHWDHLVGVADAHALGATLVTVEDNVDTIDESIGGLDRSRLLLVEDRMTLGNGRERIEIYEVATAHAARFLVVYLPRHKLLFMADHFNSPNVDDIPTANLNTISMHAALQALDIDIDRIAVAHGARIFNWRDLQRSVEDYEPSDCYANRPVCI